MAPCKLDDGRTQTEARALGHEAERHANEQGTQRQRVRLAHAPRERFEPHRQEPSAGCRFQGLM